MGFAKIELWALPRGADPYPLPHLRSWQLSPTDGDVGLLEFVYPDTGRGFADLERCADDDIDLEVEVTVRPLDGRPPWQDIAIVDEADLDDVADTGVATFRGRLLGAVFDEAVVPYHPTGDQGETAVTGTAGRVAREFLEAAQARGCFPRVTWTFTDDLDSNGQPWERQATLRFNPGQTYRAMLGTLRGYQLGEWEITPEWELRIVNVDLEDGYGLGVDRTLGANPLTLERGRDLGDAPRKWRVRDAITALVSSGKDGLYSSASDATAQARRGRRIEGYHSFGNTADAGTLAALTQRRLGTQTRGRIEVSHKVELSESGPTPLIDFAEGDRVYSATRKGVAKRRVRQVTLSGDADNVQSCAVTCGDLLDEAAVRQQEQLDAIANGEAIAGTSTPPPEADDGSLPAAPGGITANSLWYANNEGAGEASVTAAWEPVSDARVRGYVLEWRYTANPLGVVFRRMPETTETTLSWSPMSPGKEVEVRVAAVNKWDRLSTWSPTYRFIVEADGTPPAVPSAPAPFVELGFVVVPWDGAGSLGEAMPGDFWRVEVHRSTTTNFTPHRPMVGETSQLDEGASTTFRGELRGATQFVDEVPAEHRAVAPNPGVPGDTGSPGTLYYYRFVAVDRSGNASAASAQGSVTPRGIQGDEVESLAVSRLRAGVIRALVGIGDKLYAGNLNGAGWEGDAAGFRFYSMINGVRTAVLEFTAATASLLITGTFQTGRTGRRAMLSGASNELRFYPSNDETRWGKVSSYVPVGDGWTGDAIAVQMESSSAPNYDSVSRFYATPAQAATSITRADSSTSLFARMLAGRNGIDLSLYDSTPNLRRRGGAVILNRYTGSSGNVLAELGGWDWSTPSQILNRITLHMDGSIVIGSGGNNFLQLTNSDAVLVRNGTVKSFVIPHPLDDPDRPERWLVHGCTESPVAGVEYTGTAEVDELAAVTLPDYFDALVEDDGRTVQVTVVDDGGPLALVAASPIEGGRFFIRTNADRPVRVHWHVRGARRDASGFEVEPRRSDYHARGDGPYRYLIPKEGRAA